MNLRRMFAQAIVRRIAYVVVGVVVYALSALFVASDAHAQSLCPAPSSSTPTFSQQNHGPFAGRPDALVACESEASAQQAINFLSAHYLDYTGVCRLKSDRLRTYAAVYVQRSRTGTCGITGAEVERGTWTYVEECPNGGEWNEETNSCFACDINAPPLGSGHMQCAGADFSSCSYTVCSNGCGFDQPGGGHNGYVIDGRMWVLTTGWMPRGETCTVGDTPGLGTPPTDSDGDGTSDANDGAPNNPGEGGGGDENGQGQDQDGSSACGGPGQPACEEDGSNDGSGKGNTSGGGGNCQTPPSSTGDAILAQIAYQAWATRCAVEGQGQGGSGTGPGTGDGDGAKEGTLKGIKDWLDGKGEGVPEADDPWMDGLPGEPSDWNMGLGGGACPAPVSASIELGGISAPIEFSFQPMCDLAGLLNTLFKALGALIAAYIIAGVRR